MRQGIRRKNAHTSIGLPSMDVLLFSYLLTPMIYAAPSFLQTMQVVPDANDPHMRIDFSNWTEYKLQALSDPPRLVMDLANSRSQFNPEYLNKHSTVIKNVRMSPRGKHDLRVVLDLKQALAVPKPSSGRTKILRIDLNPVHQQLASAKPMSTSATQVEKPLVVVEDAPTSRATPPPALKRDKKQASKQQAQQTAEQGKPQRLSKLKLDKLVMLAEHNDNAIAQNTLGTLYYQGVSVPRDYALAVKWFTRAADHGLAEAQHNLGILYSKGLGVKRDYRQAATWLYKASKQGQAKAMYNLAIMYLQGMGVNKDPDKAAILLRKAAKKDHAQAQYLLGVIYSQGTRVKKSYLRGYAWLDVAEQRGIKEAKKVKLALVDKMSPDVVTKAKALAKRYVESYHEHKRKKAGEVDPEA